jgi:Na+/proline symporter
LSQDVISIAAPEAYHKRPVFWDRLAVALMVIIPVLIALKPPAIVFWLILFSFGMVVVSFLMPMLGTIFWKGGNKYGAISGMLVGLILVPFWMVIGEPGIPALLLGMIASPLVFIIVSLATKDKQDLGDVVDPLWEVYSEV